MSVKCQVSAAGDKKTTNKKILPKKIWAGAQLSRKEREVTYASIRSTKGKSKHWKTRQENARRLDYVKRAKKAWRTKRAA